MTAELNSEHYFQFIRTSTITITVVKGEPSEEQLRVAAHMGDECARMVDLQGELGWRVVEEEQYWDNEFDPDEVDLIVEYFLSNEDEEVTRV